MSFSNPANALKQYQQVNAQGLVENADPHRLILMLMEAALDKIALAKDFIGRQEIAQKAQHISWAISIIDGLRLSLDKEAGKEIAENLDNLYEYMERRLFQANLENDTTILDEVTSLLGEIKGAWNAIPEDVRAAHAERHAATHTPSSESV